MCPVHISSNSEMYIGQRIEGLQERNSALYCSCVGPVVRFLSGQLCNDFRGATALLVAVAMPAATRRSAS